VGILLDILSGLSGRWDHPRERRDTPRQQRRDQEAHNRMNQRFEREIRPRWNGEQQRRQQWSNDPRDWGP
jgi:hypothetical protein